jgi:hypothetical protein
MEDGYMSQRGVRCLMIKAPWFRGPVIQAARCLLTETCKGWKIKQTTFINHTGLGLKNLIYKNQNICYVIESVLF